MITLAHYSVKELFSPGQEAAGPAGPSRAQVRNSPLPNKGLLPSVCAGQAFSNSQQHRC